MRQGMLQNKQYGNKQISFFFCSHPNNADEKSYDL